MPAATGRLERAELPPTYTVIYRWRHFSSFSSVSVLHAIVTHVDPILGGTYPWAMSIFFLTSATCMLEWGLRVTQCDQERQQSEP